MSWLDYSRQLFSLDTLDPRLTTSAKPSPLNHSDQAARHADLSRTVDGSLEEKASRTAIKSGDVSKGTSPSRWRTPEFLAYYVTIGVSLYMMFEVTFKISQESDPNYENYSHLLSPGWIAGRKVDNSDHQYSSFRDNLPYMFLLLCFHPLLRYIYNQYYPPTRPAVAHKQPRSPRNGPREYRDLNNSSVSADARLEQRISFDFWFAIIFIVALHGISAVKIIIILYLNFCVATRFPRNRIPLATWIFNLGVLFSNELADGYHLAPIVGFLNSFTSSSGVLLDKSSPPHNWGQRLDDYSGIMPRWNVLFKITTLRLISFNLDYYWSLKARGGSPIEKKQLDPAALSDKDRVATPAKPQDYSFQNYVAYALYSPLYLAGPIVTFNDYIAQARYVPESISTRRTVLYGLRFLVALLTMEVILHFLYVVAISKSHPAWEVYTPFQLLMLGYFNLHIIWLKLLLPWRFFRLWSLADGIDPPENMVRCMSNNYSPIAFWRSWHRSYNRWIVRYIYIPLGNSLGQRGHGLMARAKAAINFLTVFTFVAIWHDISLTLLTWGWLICLFVLPEKLAELLFSKHKWEQNKTAYRIICGIGAVFNMAMMMAANLIGFAIGVDGVKAMIRGIVGSYSGLWLLAAASIVTFTAVQVMFEIRESELRRGIALKC